MKHPQPAFDFLLSLPGESPPAENIFSDWHAYFDREVGKDDHIRDYPEVWEFFELPDALAGLEMDDSVAIQTFEGSLNLNAIAIGLGLENVTYDPELFPALVYKPASVNAVVFAWRHDVIVAIPKGSDDVSEAASGVAQLVDRVHKLGLTDKMDFDDAITTHRVSTVIS